MLHVTLCLASAQMLEKEEVMQLLTQCNCVNFTLDDNGAFLTVVDVHSLFERCLVNQYVAIILKVFLVKWLKECWYRLLDRNGWLLSPCLG